MGHNGAPTIPIMTKWCRGCGSYCTDGEKTKLITYSNPDKLERNEVHPMAIERAKERPHAGITLHTHDCVYSFVEETRPRH